MQEYIFYLHVALSLNMDTNHQIFLEERLSDPGLTLIKVRRLKIILVLCSTYFDGTTYFL